MPALICGSLAFDTITVFPGRFAQQLLPEQLHILNVSFLVPELRREFGGCAGNIAYSLAQLGGAPLVMAATGPDGAEYIERIKGWGASTDLIKVVEGSYTAQAIIITDADNNQITAFHPGAMQSAHLTAVPQRADIAVAIIAPDGRDAMLQHAEQLAQAKVPFIFDPGQGLPMFDGDELLAFIAQASWVAVNDYESQMLQDKTGRTLADLAREVQALIVTRGSEGSSIHSGGGVIDIPCAKPSQVIDPTGCGDAYRAGLVHGLMQGLAWETTGRMASLMGAIKIESRGTQNHRFTRDAFARRYAEGFGETLDLATR